MPPTEREEQEESVAEFLRMLPPPDPARVAELQRQCALVEQWRADGLGEEKVPVIVFPGLCARVLSFGVVPDQEAWVRDWLATHPIQPEPLLFECNVELQ